MRLSDLQAELRPRTPYEATDLGLAMLREWWGPVMKAWAAVAVPWYLLGFLLLREHPLWAMLLVWWPRPLWDRVVLHVLSRALFGAVPTVRDTLKELPKLLMLSLLSLTFLRFGPTRSFIAPVHQLEGLRGGVASRRISLLRRSVGGAAIALTLACLIFELVAIGGGVSLLYMILPDSPRYGDIAFSQWADGEPPIWMQIALPAILLPALALVQPLYVAAGFGMYLNRRTLLEGWDIEIRFRQLATRLARVGLAVLVAVSLTLPGAARADEPPTPEEAVVEVLAHEDFDTRSERTEWVMKDWVADLWERLMELLGQENEPQHQFDFGLPVAMGAEALLWVLFGALLVLLLVAVLWFRLGDGADPLGDLGSLGEIQAGGPDTEAEALPPGLPDVARELWLVGRHTEALALLYRGAVEDLVRKGLPIDEGATEGECVRIVRRRLDGPTVPYFRRLVRAWQTIAYGHRVPDEQDVLPLFDAWAQHFDEEAA